MKKKHFSAPIPEGYDMTYLPELHHVGGAKVYALTKPYAPGGTTMNETYEGLKIVYTKDESEYTKRAAKVEKLLGQQLVD